MIRRMRGGGGINKMEICFYIKFKVSMKLHDHISHNLPCRVYIKLCTHAHGTIIATIGHPETRRGPTFNIEIPMTQRNW